LIGRLIDQGQEVEDDTGLEAPWHLGHAENGCRQKLRMGEGVTIDGDADDEQKHRRRQRPPWERLSH
jgi:hypothetical protein